MKSVMLSIQPKYCALISSGAKTVEIRKTKPKSKTPFKCYIYCTKPKTKSPLEILETSNFASAVDVSADFGIVVVSTEETMSAEEVMSFTVAKDLTSPDTETSDIIAVSGSNGTYTIKGVGGFREGASYRISLNNDALSFKDQSETAREYNFTVFREEVQNLSMQSDIKYIPMDKISNIINSASFSKVL